MNEMIENRIIFLLRFRALYTIAKMIIKRVTSSIIINDII